MNINKLIYIVIFRLSVTKILTLDYYIDGGPLIEIRLTQTEIINITVNTFLPYSIINKDKISFISPYYVHHNYLVQFYSKEIVSEYLTCITTKAFESTHYYLYISFQANSFNPDRGLAFGFRIHDIDYFIVKQLYNKHSIDKKQFSFNNKDKGKGTLYIGGIPEENLTKMAFKGYCQVNSTLSPWGCMLSRVIANKASMYYNTYAIFHSGFSGKIYSNKIFFLLVNTILKEEILNHICYTDTLMDYRIGVYCSEELQERKVFNETIIFEFVNLIIDYPFSSFLTWSESIYKWNIEIWNNPYNYYINYQVIFGFNFFSSFNYSHFDYDNSQIEFFSNVFSIRMKAQFFTLIKIISISNIFLLLISIIVLIFRIAIK